MSDTPDPAALPQRSAELLAEFRSQLAHHMRQAGLSDERLGTRMGFDRTTVNKVRNGLLAPSPQFAKKVREELGQALWGLWSAWDAATRGEQASTGARHRKTQAQAGAPLTTAAPRPPDRKLETVDFVAWVADRSTLSFQQAYDAVATRVAGLRAAAPAVHYGQARQCGQVTRAQLARALAAYYHDPCPDEVGAAFYRARVGGAPLSLSILVQPGWLDAAVRLATAQERFRLAAAVPDPWGGTLEGAALEAALGRLADVEVSGAVLVNNPLYQLLDFAIARHRLDAVVALADFASYALTMDLLKTELVEALAADGSRHPRSAEPPHTQTLPLRDAYLPTLSAALAVGGRLCVGGPVALLAIARGGGMRHSQREPDFALLIQQRSTRVLDVVPKALYGPTINLAGEASLSASLERELEEELLCRQDLERLPEDPCRHADPLHPARLFEPMRWLLEHRQVGAYRVECLGFGINMVTGTYAFPCLVVIDDEEWWARYGGQVQANWETARIRCYSSRDTAGLQALAADPRWSNEGLFALLEGLRRLAQLDGGSRVALPRIDVEV